MATPPQRPAVNGQSLTLAFARLRSSRARATASIDLVGKHATAASKLVLVDLTARESPFEDVQGIRAPLERSVEPMTAVTVLVLVLVLVVAPASVVILIVTRVRVLV